MSELARLFAEFVDAHNEGGCPSLEDYIRRAGAEGPVLAKMVSGFLDAGSNVSARVDGVVRRAVATVANQVPRTTSAEKSFSELISEHEESLRLESKCSRTRIVENIAQQAGLSEDHYSKFATYYHQFKTGRLDPRKATSRLLQALSDVLRISMGELLSAAAGYRPREVVQLMQFTRTDKESRPTGASPGHRVDVAAWDAVDRMFLGDGGDAGSLD